jgi:hypothetical protein
MIHSASIKRLLSFLGLALALWATPAAAQPRANGCDLSQMPRLQAEIAPRGGRSGMRWQPSYYRCENGQWVRVRAGWQPRDAAIEGLAAVEMRGGRLTVRPGFRFVQERPGGPATIARIASGPSGGRGAVTGTFDCACRCRILGSLCSNTGCTTQISGSTIECVRGGGGTCNGRCTMTTTTSGLSVLGANGRDGSIEPCDAPPAVGVAAASGSEARLSSRPSPAPAAPPAD